MRRHTLTAGAMIVAALSISTIDAQVVRIEGQAPPAAIPAASGVIPAAPVAPAATVPAPAVAVETRVRVDPIPATRAADFGLWLSARGSDGLVISDLVADGVFATAGFREGDRLVSINGQPVTTEAQVVRYLTGPAIGSEPIPVVVLRGGIQQTIVLQPGVITKGVVPYDPLYQYGIVIDDRNLNQIVVRRVFPRTPAYYAGLRVGDVITTVGGQPITNVGMLAQVLSKADAAVPVQVTRGGLPREILLDPLLVLNGVARTALRPAIDGMIRTDTIEFQSTARPTRIPDSDVVVPRTPDSVLVPPRAADAVVAPAPGVTIERPTVRVAPAPPVVTPPLPAVPAAPPPGGISIPPQKTGQPTPTNPNSSAAPTAPPATSTPKSGTGGTGGAGSSAGGNSRPR